MRRRRRVAEMLDACARCLRILAASELDYAQVEQANDCSRCAGCTRVQCRRVYELLLPRTAVIDESLAGRGRLTIRRVIGNSRVVESVLRTGGGLLYCAGFAPHPFPHASGKHLAWASVGQRHVQKGCLPPCLPQLEAVSKPTRRLGQPPCQPQPS